MAEKRFLGGRKDKFQVYIILGVLLIGGLILANAVFNNPEAASDGVDKVLGLPSWALPLILFVVGVVIFWFGLKLETDLPEGIGALLIAAAVGFLEAMVGWDKFALGGIFILPYVLPLGIFLILLFYGMMKSK